VRAELGLDTGPLVGAVGALRPQKGYDVLIEAALLLRRTHPRLRLLIAGEGPDRPRLEELIARLAASETVTLLGRRMDVPDVLAALDLAVSASNYEGSPLAVMEYMEAGLPIVATRVGGVPDLIDDGVHGLLVEPGDPAALARAVEELLADPARGAALGERARERRRREFDLDVMVASVEALYEELLAKKERLEA
jgi:glycosyltransferase involved in cell wall biosynthesis